MTSYFSKQFRLLKKHTSALNFSPLEFRRRNTWGSNILNFQIELFQNFILNSKDVMFDKPNFSFDRSLLVTVSPKIVCKYSELFNPLTLKQMRFHASTLLIAALLMTDVQCRLYSTQWQLFFNVHHLVTIEYFMTRYRFSIECRSSRTFFVSNNVPVNDIRN